MGKPGVNVESDLSSGSFALWFRKQGKRMLAPHNILGLVLRLFWHTWSSPLWTLLKTTFTWRPQI